MPDVPTKDNTDPTQGTTIGGQPETDSTQSTVDPVELERARKELLEELDKYFDMEKFRDDNAFDKFFGTLTRTNSGNYYISAPVMEAGEWYEPEAPMSGQDDGTQECPPEGLWIYFREFNTEEYAYYPENGFNSVFKSPLSTFAADVDTGSYTNLRRYITSGTGLNGLPAGLLRYEEMINYFDYKVANTSAGRFSVGYKVAKCPWNPEHSLLMMTVRANEVEVKAAPGNYTFLIDVSGSMAEKDKIELAVKSFALFTDTLGPEDRVSIVTYSGTSETLLDSCPGNDKEKIFKALRDAENYCVNWGGGTNGSGGITAAYDLAEKNFVQGGNNRVIIASDGDMNLGITGTAGLVELITEKKEKGIFLTTLGFGTGNYSDTNMEQIANAGNGNYYYIDCMDEAQRVLVERVRETMITVAKDVKFQMEFNPARVSEY